MVSSVSMEGAQRINQMIRYPVVDTSEIIEIRDEIVEETRPIVVEDKNYVAVGKILKESQLTLQWAIDNSGGRRICILLVHQPPEKIPICNLFFCCYSFLFICPFVSDSNSISRLMFDTCY